MYTSQILTEVRKLRYHQLISLWRRRRRKSGDGSLKVPVPSVCRSNVGNWLRLINYLALGEINPLVMGHERTPRDSDMDAQDR